MKNYFLPFVCWMASVMLNAWASPLQPQDVGADAAILLHVDIDSLLASSVGKVILATPGVQAALPNIRMMFEVDISSQLHGVTLYTKMDQPTNGVLIVYADFNSNRLINVAQSFPGFETSSHGAETIYSWLDEKNATNGYVPRIYAALRGKRVIFSKAERILAASLEVIGGKAAGLAASSVPVPTEPEEKVVVLGTAKRFAFDSKDPNAAILRVSKSARMQIGELKDQILGNVDLKAQDEESATQIFQIANGLKALLKLNGDPSVAKLADTMKVQQEAATVRLNMSVPSAEIADFIKKHQPANSQP